MPFTILFGTLLKAPTYILQAENSRQPEIRTAYALGFTNQRVFPRLILKLMIPMTW